MANVKLTREQAEAIAVSALAFLAGDAALLPRFLALSGIEANAIRQAAAEPGFLAGVLQFILAHEPTLMAFSNDTGTAPDLVGRAVRLLPWATPTLSRFRSRRAPTARLCGGRDMTKVREASLGWRGPVAFDMRWC